MYVCMYIYIYNIDMYNWDKKRNVKLNMRIYIVICVSVSGKMFEQTKHKMVITNFSKSIII